MTKTITIKLKKVGFKHGPFLIKDNLGNIVADDVSRKTLMDGESYNVNSLATLIHLISKGDCTFSKGFPIGTITTADYADIITTINKTGCVWQHLNNPTIYNIFYGKIEPYILDYPFSYTYQDEILQNVKDYTRAFKYSLEPNYFDDNLRIEIDGFFNKAIVYNEQQSSGILNLISKPKNNLQVYSTYPKFHLDSKTILYTKSDNFYQYNTFWSVVKNQTIPLFTKSCESMSIDKIVNQSNMDYSSRSFSKAPLRAKNLKVRHILDNVSDLHLVSVFIVTPSQLSYK